MWFSTRPDFQDSNMRYVIMANGQGTRWNMYQGVPKHLIEIDGETLLQRTTRLAHELDPNAEVIISSANPDCVAEGAKRYEPIRNVLEIDRFVPELMQDDMVFLYGDTYYTKDSLKKILEHPGDKIQFFGNAKSIVAVKIADSSLMEKYFNEVRDDFLEGRIDACKGWQVYYAYVQGEYGQTAKIYDRDPASEDESTDFTVLSDDTSDFNAPEDLITFLSSKDNENAD